MKLRIPKIKAASSGLRKLSNKNRLSKALEVLAEQPSVKKDMWIKRAKEYEKKYTEQHKRRYELEETLITKDNKLKDLEERLDLRKRAIEELKAKLPVGKVDLD